MGAERQFRGRPLGYRTLASELWDIGYWRENAIGLSGNRYNTKKELLDATLFCISTVAIFLSPTYFTDFSLISMDKISVNPCNPWEPSVAAQPRPLNSRRSRPLNTKQK